jgi:hypothetical protein
MAGGHLRVGALIGNQRIEWFFGIGVSDVDGKHVIMIDGLDR